MIIKIIKHIKEISLLIFLILEFVYSSYRLCPSSSTLIDFSFLNSWALRFLNLWAVGFTGKLRNDVGAGCANGGWWEGFGSGSRLHSLFSLPFSSC